MTLLNWCLCIGCDCVVIVCDFNIYVDSTQHRGTKELRCALDNYGLTQHATEPTHNKEHTLDFFISKCLKLWVTDAADSDHSFFFFVQCSKIGYQKTITETYREYNLFSLSHPHQPSLVMSLYFISSFVNLEQILKLEMLPMPYHPQMWQWTLEGKHVQTCTHL